MQVDSPDLIRNIALAGHNDTGKTTLASASLFVSGVATRLGRVEDGNTTTDFDAEEIERQISIGLSVCFAPWRNHKINIIDCPGYGIFFTETKAGMRAADAVVLCVNAAAGLQVLSERVWEYATKIDLPTTVHLSKMDRERADFEATVASLRERLGREVVPVQVPIGKEHDLSGVVDLVNQKAYTFKKDGDGRALPCDIPQEAQEAVDSWRNQLIEAVAESDDALMERFFEEGTLTDDELRDGLRGSILARKIVPVTVSSALHGIGTSLFLDSVVDLMPTPLDRKKSPGRTVGGDAAEIVVAADGPPTVLVFKTISDPFTGKISLLRPISGEFHSDRPYWNVQLERQERVGHLMVMQGKQGEAVPRLLAGDIGGVAKLKDTLSGHTLCDKDQPTAAKWIEAPEPSISFAIEPKSKGDEEKIGEALTRLEEEDPTLHAGRDPETGEFLISGAGQLHVEIAVAKLKKRFKVEVILHPPKVPYRETIQRAAVGHGRHKKQSGGRGQFADCTITIEPLARGQEFEFVDEIFGGSIPQQYRPAVRKGIEEARRKGYLAGYPVVDFKVRLQDGQHHDVDSSEMAFKIAGSLGFKDAMAKAHPVLLEPIMDVEISATEEFMGDIMSDLSQRRGRPHGMETKNDVQVIRASVPMSEMLTYAPALNSMTQGRGSFHMEMSHYDPVPRPVQEKIIAESKNESDAG